MNFQKSDLGVTTCTETEDVLPACVVPATDVVSTAFCTIPIVEILSLLGAEQLRARGLFGGYRALTGHDPSRV